MPDRLAVTTLSSHVNKIGVHPIIATPHRFPSAEGVALTATYLMRERHGRMLNEMPRSSRR